jgi:hypothetical protein
VARAFLLILLAAAAATAGPGPSESEILDRWDDAGPDDRRRMRAALERFERERRFSRARPIVVRLDGKPRTLAEVFLEILDPALRTPVAPEGPNDLGLAEVHRSALAALAVLRAAYAAPAPVRTGTLNLLLAYAYDAATAPDLTADVRLRFFSEAMRTARALRGRVKPDARTRFLIRNRLVPALLGMRRRAVGAKFKRTRELVAEAATLLYMPSILDADARRQLAPLTRGRESRDLLVRAHREGNLDRLGLVALARSVAAQTRDDGAFAAGAAPQVLELLLDRTLPQRERGALLDAALAQLGGLEAYRPTVTDLCAAGFGEPPSGLDAFRSRRAGEKPEPLVLPRPERRYRFLRVVLVQPPGRPPAVTSVLRIDAPFFSALYERHPSGGRQFVGVLVPSEGGRHADFLGPAPRTAGPDPRLLRRTLRLERIAVTTFGKRGEILELCVALPEDGSEPVPRQGANTSHVLALVAARLSRAADDEELADLIRLLGRIDTAEARALAARFAARPTAAVELLAIAERGDKEAARSLLGRIGLLENLELRERALAAAVGAGLRAEVRDLCAHADVGTAALAGDALMGAGDVAGVRVLLKHKNRYARACGTSLALRLTPLAGSLRVEPEDASTVGEVARLCRGAFAKSEGGAWFRYGHWLSQALLKPDRARKKRVSLSAVPVGKEKIAPHQFHQYCLAILEKEEHKAFRPGLVAFVLDPAKPGWGMSAAALTEVLDAIERRLDDPAVKKAWVDALIVLACVQHGIEVQQELLELAQVRLSKLAGGKSPPGTKRKPGVYWPIWAARETAR